LACKIARSESDSIADKTGDLEARMFELAWIDEAIVAVRRVEWKRRGRPPKWVRASLGHVRLKNSNR
jgi:hypothetical protein